MKKNLKKMTAVVLSIVIFALMIPFGIVSVSAANTADSLVAIAEGELGSTNYTKYYGGNKGAWCADFVTWCAQQAGVTSIANSSSCYYMYNGMISNGCQRVSSPQKGDIVFFYCNSCSGTANQWCHVGIMVNSTTSIDGNYGGKVSYDSSYSHYGSLGYKHSSGISKIYVRPNYDNNFPGEEDTSWNVPTWKYANSDLNTYNDWGVQESGRYISAGDYCYIEKVYTNGFAKVKYPLDSGGERWAYAYASGFPLDKKVVHWYDGLSPVNLGTDFYAYIINTHAWRHLTNDEFNVSMKDETGNANQVWNFIRQNDGSYKIINTHDGNVLDCHNFGTTDGTNVAVCESNDSSAQRWFIYGNSGEYYLRAACGDLVLDIEGGATNSGTNVQMWTKNNTIAQKFQIWGLNKAGTTHVYYNEGTTFTPTTISWNTASDTLYYDVKIWKGAIWEGDAYKILWSEQGNSCQIDLPEGYYEAYVDCRNKYSTTMSENVIKFNVSHGTPVTLGKSFLANITHYKGDYNIGVTSDENVTLQVGNKTDNQKWLFELQSDDSYKITNIATNKCLDIYNVQSENGTNVQVWNKHDTEAQLFYLRQLSNGYAFIPKCSLSSAIDIEYGNIQNGTNIQEWEFNGEASQTFSIEYLSLNPVETIDFKGHKYEYYNIETSWDQAYMICDKKGGHLVAVESQEENDFIKEISNKYENYCWIGYTDLHQEGKWYWINGATSSYTNWYSGEPNNVNDCEHYACMYTNSGLWNDTSLFTNNKNTGFICEYENEDVSYNEFQPEKIFTFNGIKYEVYNYSVDWQTANRICKDKGGELVCINSSAENEAIKNAIENSEFANSYWINVTDVNFEGNWSNSNGSSLSFANWNDNEPNNSYNIENYAVIQKNGKWNDMYGFSAFRLNIGFICKYKFKTGDTNLDGKVDINDVTSIQMYLAELEEFTDEQLAVADVNGDGEVDINDATYLQMYLADLVDKLG